MRLFHFGKRKSRKRQIELCCLIYRCALILEKNLNSTNANILEPREYCRHAYDLTNYWSIFVRFEFSDKNTLYNDGWVRPQPRFIERTNSI